MKGILVFILVSALGAVVTGQYTQTMFPTYQKNGQVFTMQTTTPSPVIVPTTVSLSPQTSVSVHHTIVRNRPAYPYPYAETTLQSDGEDNYDYTYEDTSEENNAKYSTTPITTTSPTTVKSAARSFWNSQKAQLDARRKESSQKFMPTYNRPTVRAETKQKVEFKVREKPKFGLSNRVKETTTTPEPKIESVAQFKTTTPKSVKNNINEANLAEEKSSAKEDSSKGQTKGTNSNQILGRVGEIPVQNKFSTQIQSPNQAQNKATNRFGASRQTKLSESNINTNTGKQQAAASTKNFTPITPQINSRSQPPASAPASPVDFLINLNKQQILNSPQQHNNLLDILNGNQQSQPQSNNLQGLLTNQQQQPNQPNPNTNQQPSLLSMLINGIQSSQPTAFLATSPGVNPVARSAEPLGEGSLGSSLLQRLGSLALNAADSGLILPRDGGFGGPQGLTLNLGPVSDPLSILLKLLSLIPRPLLDLHGRIFFGIELGKNAGLVSGAGAKPVVKPIG
ncbi:uncharacterized protein CDAR_20931 [Caerostris darwini]|uniref:Uncharacterized protein n=1 Tax=Caerostris darwini TaxID=1538125 RepID=A0AAV4N0I5_9ARAC|nr:uncharacterized protein CDAR_20931 [Caerostris darwini]